MILLIYIHQMKLHQINIMIQIVMKKFNRIIKLIIKNKRVNLNLSNKETIEFNHLENNLNTLNKIK